MKESHDVVLCDPYAWEDPLHFIQTTWRKGFVCVVPKSPCVSEVVNQILFLYIFIAAIGCILAVAMDYILVIPIALTVVTIYLIPAFLALPPLLRNPPKLEPFVDVPLTASEKKNGIDIPPATTVPTSQNPFMNVMLPEIQENPTRPPAADIGAAGAALDNAFRVQYTSDPTDVFGKTQSQRQFVAMPCTTVPNDQGSFANWLYRIPGKTCKEGNRAVCLPGTDGAAVPWLNQER